MTDLRLVMVTAPVGEAAETLAQTLVQEKHVACVNRVPNLTSTYHWQGKIETDAEELLLMKTLASKVEDLLARIRDLHPYECPEAIVLNVADGLPAYLAWVRDSVS